MKQICIRFAQLMQNNESSVKQGMVARHYIADGFQDVPNPQCTLSVADLEPAQYRLA